MIHIYPNSIQFLSFSTIIFMQHNSLNKTTNKLNIQINILFTFILNIYIQPIKKVQIKNWVSVLFSLEENIIKSIYVA